MSNGVPGSALVNATSSWSETAIDWFDSTGW